ncbi:hypothetical protein, partial [Pseudomonas aeruginosa]|uniref:hypothetical protein n=1 Tax=Pseudomonas aeruginosa TaxID=287 RepID=UPI0031B6BE9A
LALACLEKAAYELLYEADYRPSIGSQFSRFNLTLPSSLSLTPEIFCSLSKQCCPISSAPPPPPTHP